ncbi:MAG: NAD(P)/FAD-dependent oxidoreductase [Spirochaetaceae bacterium]|nr:NAD(P)/FAD-dependent oxidoreductase [Spirochaetaceae bacterium]
MKYNCIIIGSGPAGFYSALSCSKNGYRTAIIENAKPGGTGFRTGCLPLKKNLDILRKIEEAVKISDNNIKLEPDFKANLIKNTENNMVEAETIILKRLEGANIDVYLGDGEFIDSNTFQINDKRLEADYFIIATGSSPESLHGIPLNGKNIISHNEALALSELPEDMVIIGGNVEGIEMAVLFASLGVTVTIIEQLELILEGTDRDLVEPVLKNLREKGVSFYTEVIAESVVEDGKNLKVNLTNGIILRTEKILITGSRKINMPRGIGKTGVKYSKNGISVNEKLMSNVSNIFAVGDVNGMLGMAHVAIQQGILITEGLSGKQVTRDYKSLPRAMFTIPEIAGAGDQECNLDNSCNEYLIKKYLLKSTWRGFSKKVGSGFIKLIFKREILTGIWMTGPDASEVLAASGLLIGQKLTQKIILDNLFIHPTMGEALLEAAITA